MTASQIFFYCCFSFIIGIFLGSTLNPAPFYLLKLGFFSSILLAVVSWKKRKLAVLFLFAPFLILGVWRYQFILSASSSNPLNKYNDIGQLVEIIGVVAEDPGIREKSVKLTIKPETIASDRFGLERLPSFAGKILVTVDRYSEYRYGDKIKMTGNLEEPAVFDDFNYKDYLKKDGIYSVVNFPKTELMGSGYGNPFTVFLFSFKKKFKDVSIGLISPPQEGILEALVFGDEGGISKRWKDKLNITGTRHIAAVSGMNITIIAFLILSFALSIGFWRKQALFVSIFLIFLYVLMIGAPPSAIRAGIMGSLLMFAQYFGRMSGSIRAVVFAASLMIYFNPLLLTLDVGFQLSFLAILGLIYFQPAIFNWLTKVPNYQFFPIRTTLSATLAAQLATLPILVYNFGYFSLVSPIANALIVPILAPLTILLFVFGISGILFYPLGQILSFLVWPCLSYIIFIVDWFSRVSFASVAVQNIHWIFLIIAYVILGFFAFWLDRRERLKFLNY